ncbi:hypothetical protein N0V90_005097 [Kalmusia sp. IMI 367209]|nr:hypothetical protein N0V90_005097 [Kalmusia sp. IMI 367209]
MRTLAYLTNALTLSQETCDLSIGVPGGVYICERYPKTCSWYDPIVARHCIPWDAENLGVPFLIGPDYGGISDKNIPLEMKAIKCTTLPDLPVLQGPE